SNQGFFQSMRLLILCHDVPELTDCDSAYPLAERHILEYLQRYFSSDGVHLEHSPHYHADVILRVEGLLDSGVLSETASEEVRHFYLRSQEALAWFVLPNGMLTQFGD